MALEIGDYLVDEGPLGPMFEKVYEVIGVTPITIKLKEIKKKVAWNDSSYRYPQVAAERCVIEGLALRYYMTGNSGIRSRNWFVLETNQLAVTASLAKRVKNYGKVIEVSLEDITEETKVIFIADPEVAARCLQILMEERKREALAEWEKLLGEKDVVECKEFNKTLAYNYINEPPTGFAVATQRSTSCGNTTAVLVRLKGKIRCPKDLKGAVIGRGGQNIKRLSIQYGWRIELI